MGKAVWLYNGYSPSFLVSYMLCMPFLRSYQVSKFENIVILMNVWIIIIPSLLLCRHIATQNRAEWFSAGDRSPFHSWAAAFCISSWKCLRGEGRPPEGQSPWRVRKDAIPVCLSSHPVSQEWGGEIPESWKSWFSANIFRGQAGWARYL